MKEVLVNCSTFFLFSSRPLIPLYFVVVVVVLNEIMLDRSEQKKSALARLIYCRNSLLSMPLNGECVTNMYSNLRSNLFWFVEIANALLENQAYRNVNLSIWMNAMISLYRYRTIESYIYLLLFRKKTVSQASKAFEESVESIDENYQKKKKTHTHKMKEEDYAEWKRGIDRHTHTHIRHPKTYLYMFRLMSFFIHFPCDFRILCIQYTT